MSPRVVPAVFPTEGEYGPKGPFSFFRDLARVAVYNKLQESDAAIDPDPEKRAQFEALTDILEPLPHADERYEGGIEEARARLGSVQKIDRANRQVALLERARRREHRDVTTADPGAAAFIPAGAPAYVAEDFATAAAATATFAAAIRTEPLPRVGSTVSVPKVDSGASADVQTAEEDPPSETDFDGALVESPKALIVGQQDVSVQAADFTDPGLDLVMARELGKKVGEKVDQQALHGTGLNGDTLGVVATSDVLSVSYTDASPTPAEALPKLWGAYASLATPTGGYGIPSLEEYLVVMHPRRLAWFHAAGQASQVISPVFPGRPVPCAGISTALGANTNADAVVILARNESILYLGQPRFRAIADFSGAGSLIIRFQAYQYAAMVAGRAPTSVAVVTGTGFAGAPTF